MMRRFLPHAQILAAALLFSTGGMGVKSCGLTAAQVASFRCGIAALTLLVCLPWLLRATRPAGTLEAATAAGAALGWRHALVGLLYATTLISFVLANKATSASNAIFLQSTAPLYIFLLAPWLLGERQRRSDIVMMLLLALGMAFLLLGQVEVTAVAPAPLQGNLLAALGGLAWAGTLMGLRLFSGPSGAEGSVKAVIIGNLLGFLLVLPWALPVLVVSTQDVLWMLYLGVFQVGLAYLLLTRGLRHLSAFDAAILLLVEPLCNPVWAYLVHSEVPRGLALVGALIILAVTAIRPFLQRRSSQRRPIRGVAHG